MVAPTPSLERAATSSTVVDRRAGTVTEMATAAAKAAKIAAMAII